MKTSMNPLVESEQRGALLDAGEYAQSDANDREEAEVTFEAGAASVECGRDGEDGDDGEEVAEAAVLRRSLTLLDGLGVVVGIMIGSGIFASAGTALDNAGSGSIALASWTVAGLLVGLASCCYCELGASVPSAAGDAEYLRLAYGEKASFVFIWTNFWVFKPGSQAIIAIVFGEYLAASFSGEVSSDASIVAKLLAVGAIVLLTGINLMGVRETANLQNLLTVLKAAMIFALFAVGLVHLAVSHSGTHTLRQNMSGGGGGGGGAALVLGVTRAIVPCLWAFDGWADLGSLAEEMRFPERDLPLVILFSISIVAGLYLLCNVAYFAVLDQDAIIDADAVAIDFSNALGGGVVGRAAVAGGVALSTLGSCNGSIMTGGRIFFAVARDGTMGNAVPRCLGVLNGAGAPQRALLAQAAWAVALLLIPGSSFASLLDYFGPASWLFYAFTSSATVALRRKLPDLPRPFRMPLFPFPPILVCVMSACIVIESLAANPLFCSIALFFVACGAPVHTYFARARPDEAPASDHGGQDGRDSRDHTHDESGLGRSIVPRDTYGDTAAKNSEAAGK